MSQNVTLPRWVLAAIGSVLGILLAGLMTWLTSINMSVTDNAVQIAAIRAELDHSRSDISSIKASIDRVNDKLDRLIERVAVKPNAP